MFHSRGFAPHENQPFAAQTRTPGPSRSHLSPNRSKAMTTGKRALGDKSKLFGQESAALGPKQLFKELASKTPARALGDLTNKTPGLRNRQDQQEDGSPTKKSQASSSKGKGKKMLQSPAKGSQSVSPKKAIGQPLRALNSQLKENAATPFSRGNQSYATDMSSVMTPGPNSSLLKGCMLSRQTSFVTPAANIGKAGQIKARMGEMLDAELGISLGDLEAIDLEQTQAQKQMTEEELYPEIEYMPPSTWATNPPYEYPSELDGVPSASELARQLAAFRSAGFLKGMPAELSDTEDVKTFADESSGTALDLGPRPRLSDDNASDDEFWPDVPIDADVRAAVPLAAAPARLSGHPKSGSARSTAISRAPVTATSIRTGAASVSSSGSRPTSSVASRPISAATTARMSSSASSLRSKPVSSASKPPTSSVAAATATSARPRSKVETATAISRAASFGTSVRSTGVGTAAADSAWKPLVAASGSTDRVARSRATTTKPAMDSTQLRNATLQRSIAPPPLSSVAGRRLTSILARQPARAPPPASTTSRVAAAPPPPAKPRMQMNAKLRDLENDDLGVFVERKMQESTADASFEGFDLASDALSGDEHSDAESSVDGGAVAAATTIERNDLASELPASSPPNTSSATASDGSSQDENGSDLAP